VDTLLVDMPPGTGDVAISLGQLLPRSEVVVVTTPQPAAQEVAVRAAEMARKTGQRVIGVIENMAGDVFGSGGGAELAETVGVPLLGTVELDPRLREQADEGEPLVAVDPQSETSRAIADVAAALAASRRGIRKQLPVLS
jgi:ATP-binding protein involved in chromosome partitioning